MLLHAMSICNIQRSLYFAHDYIQICLFFFLKRSLHLFCYTLLFYSLLFFLLVLCSHSPPGPHGFRERLAASQEAMKNKNVVNLGAIRQGMKRFQFLLNCCEPGTIPDASILAAALDLVCFRISAPWSLCPQMLPRYVIAGIKIYICFLVLPGSSSRGPGLPLPRMRPICPPL